MKKIAVIVLMAALTGCGGGGYYSSYSPRHDSFREAAEMQRWVVESPHYQAGGSSYVDYTK